MLSAMNETEIARELQRAGQFLQSGRVEEAAAACERALEAAPRSVDAVHLLGLVRKHQHRWEEAEQLLRRSADLAPRRADVQANLANLLSTLGRTEQAEFVYRAALDIDPAFRAARLGLARLLVRAGRPEAALPELNALLSADREDVEALALLASALKAQERLTEAETIYREVLRLAPDNRVARHNLGAVLADQHRPGEALTEYRAAADAGLDSPELATNMARASLALDRRDEAIALLEQTIERFPAAVDPHALLTKLRYMGGEADFARDMRSAAGAQPTNLLLQRSYAMLLRGSGDTDAASEALERAMAGAGRHPALLSELGCARQEAGDYETALALAREAAETAPDQPSLRDGEIDALLSLGRADEALPVIRAGRRRQPLNQWYIACEATAARLLEDPLYGFLYDYERLVRAYELPAPAGWSGPAEFNRDLAAVLRERHRFRMEPLDQSLRGGTQTPVSLLADPDPVIRAYREALMIPIRAYREEVGSDPDHPLTARNRGEAVLQGAWSVRLGQGGYHVNHVHPEGWVSSAYYVEVPAEVADEQARRGWIGFGAPRYPVPGADVAHWVRPREGHLVLFPSYLWHGTRPLAGDAPRMTAPIDVITRS